MPSKIKIHVFAGGSDETFRELEKTKPHVALVSSGLPDGSLTGFKVLFDGGHGGNQLFTTSWAVNIPNIVGGNTA
jgi:hypothetical protein